MARIQIASVASMEWVASRQGEVADGGFDRDAFVVVPADSPEPVARFHHAGSETSPQLIEIKLPPGDKVAPHAHDEDEIIVVLEGELLLGARTVESGGSVYVPGNTLYSFTAGPTGLRYLNFRPRQDLSFRTKAQVVAARRAANSG